MAIFCVAIPVGSALGYVLGGIINHQLGWRWAFYLVAIPGIILGLLCFFQKDPRARTACARNASARGMEDYLTLLRTRSFVFNCLAQTAMTFALGGLAFWMPAYLIFRNQPPDSRDSDFWRHHRGRGAYLDAFSADLPATGCESVIAARTSWFPASECSLAFPFFIAMLYTPFPLAWVLLFGAMFFVFLNTGPSNTALANVAGPKVRATAFAFNILIIHALGRRDFAAIDWRGGRPLPT